MRPALKAAFAGEVGKDVVSRTWRKVKGDWDAWNARSLTDERIIRLFLDGGRARAARQEGHVDFVPRCLGRAGGRPKGAAGDQEHSGESEAAWRALLDDLVKRGLKTPELAIIDGAPGLEKAPAVL